MNQSSTDIFHETAPAPPDANSHIHDFDCGCRFLLTAEGAAELRAAAIPTPSEQGKAADDVAQLETRLRWAGEVYRAARRDLERLRGELAIAKAVADGSFDREPDLDRELNYYGVVA